MNHRLTTRRRLALGLLGTALSLLTACTSLPTTQQLGSPEQRVALHVKKGTTPFVVFQSGLGDGKSTWADVISRLPTNVSVFAYDRPGYGDSDGTEGARSPCAIATELHTLLQRANIPPPYILVGHSLGGLYQDVFARQYPDEVAALVLLDPTHPRHWERLQADAPAQATIVRGLRLTAFSAAMRREFDDQYTCPPDATPLNTPATLLFSGRRRPEELGSFETMLLRLREDWKTRYTAPQTATLREATHYLQTQAPAAVVDAIRQALAGKRQK